MFLLLLLLSSSLLHTAVGCTLRVVCVGARARVCMGVGVGGCVRVRVYDTVIARVLFIFYLSTAVKRDQSAGLWCGAGGWGCSLIIRIEPQTHHDDDDVRV